MHASCRDPRSAPCSRVAERLQRLAQPRGGHPFGQLGNAADLPALLDPRHRLAGIDVALTSSQKGFALPPGLAFAAVSDRVLERAKQIRHRGYYFDFIELDYPLGSDIANSLLPITVASSPSPKPSCAGPFAQVLSSKAGARQAVAWLDPLDR